MNASRFQIAPGTLYLVTDSCLCGERSLEDVVLAAVRGGASLVQFREKTAATRDFVAQAVRLKKLLAPFQVPLIVNDRVDVALAAGADGVHVGQNDLHPAEARRILGPRAIIGLSVETLAQAGEAESFDVDYIAAGPVFMTPTKKDAGSPWGIEGLKNARRQTARPLIAIGGISISNVTDVVVTGIDGVAVVSAIMTAEYPEQAARELKTAIVAANDSRRSEESHATIRPR
jgi:thiamine-phosphate pyrophosphorylase